MLLGAGTMAPLVRRLLPHAEIVRPATGSPTSPTPGPKKLTRLPRRSAVVAFCADQVYAIAELIRRQRGGAAVVMGVAQPAHPQRPGRALPVRRGRLPGGHRRHRHGPEHGRRPRGLRGPAQVRRQAHALPAPAGDRPDRRPRRAATSSDGTFGVTGEAEDMDPDLVEAVENHRFEPVAARRVAQRASSTSPRCPACCARWPGRPSARA